MTATASRPSNGERPACAQATSACSGCESGWHFWEGFARCKANPGRARPSASSFRETACDSETRVRAAGGTGERVAREPLTGRVRRERTQVEGSGPVGERATPTPGQDPLRNRDPAKQALVRGRQRFL